MIRVYVAGKYSANNVIDVLKNIGRGERVCAELFEMGFAPFCPWHDKDFVIKNPDADIPVQQFKDASMAWLEVSDCVFVISVSSGVDAEITRAEELGIPVFYNLDVMEAWATKGETNGRSKED